MSANFRWRLTAGYSSGCFCERPALPVGATHGTSPRWHFRSAVRAFAAEHGLTALAFNRVDRGAVASLPAPCRHRPAQTVRIEWELVY